MGIICTLILFLGVLGLSRYLIDSPRLALSALVIYAAAAFAIINAAVLSGLVAPKIAQQILSGPPVEEIWQAFSRYNGWLNHAFAAVFTAASSVAIVLWSVAMFQNKTQNRSIGIYGCILGPMILAGLFSGHLQMDIHGFGMTVLCQGIWYVATGILLWRHEAT